jgi:hypothetical protein
VEETLSKPFLERYSFSFPSIKTINILACALVVSLLLGEFALSTFNPIRSVRLVQLIILYNLLVFGFRFISNISLYFITTLVFLVHSIFYFSYYYVSIDLINIAWWTIFCFILNFYLRSFSDFNLFYKTSIYLSFFWCATGAFIGLYKLKMIVGGTISPWMEYEDPITGRLNVLAGTSLSGDYNVYSIGIYCGFFSGLYIYRQLKSSYMKVLIASILFLMILAGVLSTSRRALILAPIMILVYLFSRSNMLKSSNSLIKFKFSSPKLSPKFWPWKILVLFGAIFLLSQSVDIKSLFNKSIHLRAYLGRMSTVENITSKKQDTRSIRWKYSWEYFKKLPLENKIFGDGFKYEKIIGSNFKESPIDHPHNVFLSALLYGGILGFFLTLCLTGYLFYLYFVRWSFMGVFSVWYLLVMFLNFTSSNSIYSSRLGVFLLLFPMLNFWKDIGTNRTTLLELKTIN